MVCEPLQKMSFAHICLLALPILFGPFFSSFRRLSPRQDQASKKKFFLDYSGEQFAAIEDPKAVIRS